MDEVFGLISLDEAARNPKIKYRTVEGGVSLKRKPAYKSKAAHARAMAQRRAIARHCEERCKLTAVAAMVKAQKPAPKINRWIRSLNW